MAGPKDGAQYAFRIHRALKRLGRQRDGWLLYFVLYEHRNVDHKLEIGP